MSDTKKVLGLLGLAQRSGKIVSGEFMVEKAVKGGFGLFVIVAADASDNTKKKFKNMCTFYNVPFVETLDKDTLGRCIGRQERSSLALTDSGFARAIRGML